MILLSSQKRIQEPGGKSGACAVTGKVQKLQAFFRSGHCHIENASLLLNPFSRLQFTVGKYLLIAVGNNDLVKFQSLGAMYRHKTYGLPFI